MGREWYQQIVEYVLELLLGTYGELMVQWDGMKGTASVGKQTNLQIVGFDPSKGDERGVWRKKTILEKWLIYSA